MRGGAALFGNSAARSQNKNLVEFKAGKMTMKGKMVHPDKRKGLVYVYQSEDSLMHFCWKDRQTGTVEDDLIIFPDDCEFKRVAQCTTGRVYILKFKSSSRKYFFWLQEPKTDKDEELCRRVHEALNNPPTPGAQRSGGATPDGDLQNLLNNMSQQQLMQLFGGVGQIGGLSSLLGTLSRPSTVQGARSSSSSASTQSSSTTPRRPPLAPRPPPPPAPGPAPGAADTTASTTTSSTTASKSSEKEKPPIQLSDLQNFLSSLTGPGPSDSASSPSVDLSTVLTTDNLQALVRDPALAETLGRHLPQVGQDAASDKPEGPAPPPAERLEQTLASPPFQQAVSNFSAALQSGQLAPVVQQLDVGSEAVSAAQKGNMEAFVKALEKTSISAEPDKGKRDDKKKDDGSKKPKDDADEDDESMSLD
ncbi:LOW QUALITY PROTEIN: proteasomal ubiquitin receptor ADRM1-like [Bacillus rossius redtenbacheri]|uniref:LOW QUALITY PROTEIN: proteasomal ubiquitin receptor ADRM1-like n=1 Tax=Bacillus rossius redtenbacheri TaxID=93214 RepID=UPI002FDD4DB9